MQVRTYSTCRTFQLELDKKNKEILDKKETKYEHDETLSSRFVSITNLNSLINNLNINKV